MRELQLGGLEALLKAKLQDTTLSDKSLGPILASTRVEKDLPIELDEVTFTVKGDAQVLLFNSKDDSKEEEDSVIGSVLPDGGDRAWLKYAVGLGAKADGGVSSKGFGFSFGVKANARLIHYCVHDPSTNAWDAVTADLRAPRFALVADHLAGLSDGEALVLQAGGSLTLGLEVSWSALYSRAVTALTDLLAPGEVLALEADASAGASFELSVEDTFLLQVVGAGDKLRLSVKKSATRSGTAGANAGVEIGFADPDQAKALLDQVVDALVGTKVDQLLAEIKDKTYAQLDAGLREKVEGVLARLDAETGGDPLAALRARVDHVRERADKIIDTVVKLRLKAGFEYEYARVKSESTVLEAELTPAAARARHGDIVRGRLDRLLRASAQADSGVQLTSFLRTTRNRVEQSYGFGLTLGTFSLSGENEIKRSEKVEEKREAGGPLEKRVSVTCERGYKAAWFGDRWSFLTTWQGTMAGFAAAPKADDLAYGVAVALERVERRVSSDELSRFLDLAEIWGVLPPERKHFERTRLARVLDGAEDVTLSCCMKLEHQAVYGVLAEIGRGDRQRAARALARAMPWGDSSIRSDPDKREQIYAPLWLLYLTETHLDPKDLARAAYSKLRWKYPALAARERDGAKGPGDEMTIGGLAKLNGTVRGMWSSLAGGASDLLAAIQKPRPWDEVVGAFEEMRRAGEQKHWSRALGAYLLDLLESRPLFFPRSERIAAASFQKGGAKKVVTLTGATGPGPT